MSEITVTKPHLHGESLLNLLRTLDPTFALNRNLKSDYKWESQFPENRVTERIPRTVSLSEVLPPAHSNREEIKRISSDPSFQTSQSSWFLPSVESTSTVNSTSSIDRNWSSGSCDLEWSPSEIGDDGSPLEDRDNFGEFNEERVSSENSVAPLNLQKIPAFLDDSENDLEDNLTNNLLPESKKNSSSAVSQKNTQFEVSDPCVVQITLAHDTKNNRNASELKEIEKTLSTSLITQETLSQESTNNPGPRVISAQSPNHPLNTYEQILSEWSPPIDTRDQRNIGPKKKVYPLTPQNSQMRYRWSKFQRQSLDESLFQSNYRHYDSPRNIKSWRGNSLNSQRIKKRFKF